MSFDKGRYVQNTLLSQADKLLQSENHYGYSDEELHFDWSWHKPCCL